MLIRAGATNAPMVAALGINIKALNSLIFALGAGLAGLAGLMSGPILSVQPGMGDPILILTLVVIIIGGIGSVRGALLGALLVGVVETVGPDLPADLAGRAVPAHHRPGRGACHRVDVDLPADGRRAGLQAPGAVPGARMTASHLH